VSITLSILHWRCLVDLDTGEVIRELIDFQYSIGDAALQNMNYAQIVEICCSFQYSIGDAGRNPFGLKRVFSWTFNTPLEMPDCLSHE